jgi:hypothetical protein
MIDQNPKTIAIGAVVFIVVLFVTRHFLNEHYVKKGLDEDNSQTIGYSVLTAFLVSLVVLLLYTRYIIYTDSIDLLDEPFKC